jgi:hypothetical protein
MSLVEITSNYFSDAHKRRAKKSGGLRQRNPPGRIYAHAPAYFEELRQSVVWIGNLRGLEIPQS